MPNGKYHVKFNGQSKTINPYDIIFQDSLYIIIRSNGDSSTGIVNWLGNFLFQLKPNQPNPDSLSDLAKFLRKSFGQECIEVNELVHVGNTFNFRTTYTGNLHITVNTGQFIKIPSTQ
jgi:hypothetical protein